MQIEARKQQLKEFTSNEIEAERTIVKADLEKAEKERVQRRENKHYNAKTLREFYLKQQEDKKNAKTIEKMDNRFRFQFPFIETDEKPFMIPSPKKEVDLSKTVSVSLPRELPLQLDLHTQQHAYRLLKDYHRKDTFQSANARAKATIDFTREAKIREKEDFENMISAMRREEEVKRQLRNFTMKLNRSQLEQQIQNQRTQKLAEEKELKTFSSGTLMIGSPEAALAAKAAGQSMIRETLLKQIKEKARKNIEEREKDVLYGKKLRVLAGLAQKQE